MDTICFLVDRRYDNNTDSEMSNLQSRQKKFAYI